MDKYNIVVLGAHYSTLLGVVRSFGVAGYKVDIVFVGNYGADIASSSKYVDSFYHINGRSDIDIVQLLLDKYKSKTVLLPSDDYTASVIDRYRDILHTRFFMPYVTGNKQGAITHLMDKYVQCQLANEASLNVAKTWSISLKECKIQIPFDMVYPCFVKPCISAERGKFGMCRCDDMKSLESALCILKNEGSNSKVVVQEYLDIEDEIQLTGICSGPNVYLPAIIKRLRVAEKSKGCTLYGEIQPYDEIGDQYPLIVSMLEKLNYTGLIVVDLIVARGKIYFSELNFRSSGVLYAMTMAGVNLPEKFLNIVTKTPDDSIYKDDVSWGMRFLNDKVLWEDLNAGLISKEDFNSMTKSTSHYIINDATDQGPYLVFRNSNNSSLIDRVKRKIIHILHI